MRFHSLLVSCLPMLAAVSAGAAPIDLQPRIDAAAAAGGGRVCVPAGTWETKKIHLRSGVELHLEDGATLRFSENPADYLPNVWTSWQGEEMWGLSPLVYAYGATNVAITGAGTLCTENGAWRDWMRATKGRRPQFIQFFRCRNVRLDGFRVRGSPFWTIHLYRTDDARVSNLDVSAFDASGLALMNSDGLDLECARRVTVTGCAFRQGDDAIVIKSGRDEDGIRRGIPTEDVLIENCVLHEGHTLLGVGSEVGGGVRNVTLRNCRVAGAVDRLFFVKTNAKRGGFIENVRVEGVAARTVRAAVVALMADYWYYPPPGAKNLHRTPIRGIAARDISVEETGEVVNLRGDPELPARGFTVENIRAARVRCPEFVKASNVEDLRLGGIVVARPPNVPLKKDDPSRGGQEP